MEVSCRVNDNRPWDILIEITASVIKRTVESRVLMDTGVAPRLAKHNGAITTK